MDTSRFPPVDITFSYAWWHHHYQMDFSREYWLDPVRRTEQDRSMERLLDERFGDVGLGDPDPRPRPNIAICGHRFISAVLGCDITYFADQAPATVPRPIAPEEMLRLSPPDVGTSLPVQEVLRQASILIDRYGFCSGEINMGGPLNVASLVFGDEIFQACAWLPEAAHHVLDLLARTMIQVYDGVSCVVEPAQHQPTRRQILLGNCPVIMLSPSTYRTLVLPHDVWYRRQAGVFTLHHCGVMDRYLSDYRQLGLPDPDIVEVGWGTDLRAARRTFPGSRFRVMFNVYDVVHRTPAELDQILASLVQDGGPPELIESIWIAEAGTEISDEQVRHLRTYADRL